MTVITTPIASALSRVSFVAALAAMAILDSPATAHKTPVTPDDHRLSICLYPKMASIFVMTHSNSPLPPQ